MGTYHLTIVNDLHSGRGEPRRTDRLFFHEPNGRPKCIEIGPWIFVARRFSKSPPKFEAAGQQHSGIGARVAGAHAHAHTYARVPARTPTHSARHAAGMTPSPVGRQPPDRPPRPPSAPSIGPPGEIGHRFAQEAVGPNATPRPKMERWRNFRG